MYYAIWNKTKQQYHETVLHSGNRRDYLPYPRLYSTKRGAEQAFRIISKMLPKEELYLVPVSLVMEEGHK